jgi:hypothetical protein
MCRRPPPQCDRVEDILAELRDKQPALKLCKSTCDDFLELKSMIPEDVGMNAELFWNRMYDVLHNKCDGKVVSSFWTEARKECKTLADAAEKALLKLVTEGNWAQVKLYHMEGMDCVRGIIIGGELSARKFLYEGCSICGNSLEFQISISHAHTPSKRRRINLQKKKQVIAGPLIISVLEAHEFKIN